MRLNLFSFTFVFSIERHRLHHAYFDGTSIERVLARSRICRRFFSRVRLTFPMKAGIRYVRWRTDLDHRVWEVWERVPARGPLQYMLTSYNVETDDFLSTRVERIESVRGEAIPLRVMLKEGRFIRTSFDGLVTGCPHPADSLSIFLVLGSTCDSTVRSHPLVIPAIRSSSSFRSLDDGRRHSSVSIGASPDDRLVRLAGGSSITSILATFCKRSSSTDRPGFDRPFPMPPFWSRSNWYARWHTSTGVARMA